MAEFHSFLLPGNASLYIYRHVYTHIHQVFFIHPSADGHLPCFHALAIVKNAAMKIGMHVSFQISSFVSNQYMPGSGFGGSYDSSVFVFLRNLHSIFLGDFTSFHPPPTRAGGLPFSTCSVAFLTCRLSDGGHSAGWEAMAHPGLDSVSLMVGAAVVHLDVFFGEMSLQVFCSFFNQVGCFCNIELSELFTYFGN